MVRSVTLACEATLTTVPHKMPEHTPHLFTLGYEGLDIDAFIARIGHFGIETVLDVRELPLSRKRGFSKSSLREHLGQVNVAYLHVPTLGCPKPIRDQYRADSDWDAYTRAFLAYIAGQKASVRELVKLSRTTKTCLICFEADFTTCHRTYVARAALKQGGLPVMHLTSETTVVDHPIRASALADRTH